MVVFAAISNAGEMKRRRSARGYREARDSREGGEIGPRGERLQVGRERNTFVFFDIYEDEILVQDELSELLQRLSAHGAVD